MTTLLLILFLVSGDINGRVISIEDGDTITILVDSRPVRVRFFGIDSPERGQDYYRTARKRVSVLCYRTDVKVQPKGKDVYGRTLGIVFLADGRNLNQLLVEEGLAWWFQKYAPRDKKLKSLEEAARKAKRGLWSMDDPIPPWEYRKPIW